MKVPIDIARRGDERAREIFDNATHYGKTFKACLGEIYMTGIMAGAAAAPDLAAALAAIVHTLHARPDIVALFGFHEHAQIKAACDALNKAGGMNGV